MSGANISTAKKRAGLKRQHEPHWYKISRGVYLGYRVGETNTWRARVRDRSGVQQRDSIELSADDIELADGDEFTAAKKKCEEFAAMLLGTGIRAPKLATIRAALTDGYIAHLIQAKRSRSSIADIRKKLGLGVLGNSKRPADPLASVLLGKATDADFKGWRDRLAAKPGKPQYKNVLIKYLRTGLNRALKEGYVGNKQAWACLELFPVGGHTPSAYLNLEQRRHYQKACASTDEGAALANFARGMYSGGARPIDAARATVKDFDARNGQLTFYTCKGKTREWRPYVHPLSSADVAWLSELTKGKLPTAYLFPMADGGQWSQKDWSKAFAKAEAIANEGRASSDPLYLPATTRANSWRHSKITELLTVSREDMGLVATWCGTSVAQIKATYLHVIPTARVRASMDMLQAA